MYIVECRDGTLYTGIAKDVGKRIEVHNAGKGAKYTRARGPVRLLFCLSGLSKSTALSSEYEIKALNRLEKQMLCEWADEGEEEPVVSRAFSTL